jgi:hypothetical protein
MTQQIPPPFIIGETYEDWDGPYKVISFSESSVEFERPDRSQGSGTIEGKAMIYRNVLLKRKHPELLRNQKSPLGQYKSAYPTYEEVTPIVAEVIEKHSKRSRDYMTHASIVEALLSHPEARHVIDGISDEKTLEGRAGVIPAFFGKQYFEGRWRERFEQTQTRPYGYKLRRKTVR